MRSRLTHSAPAGTATVGHVGFRGIAVHSEFQMVQFLQNLATTSSVPLFRALACFFQLVHQCATVGNCVGARNHRFFTLLLSPIRNGWTSRLRRPPTSPQVQDMDEVIEFAGIRKSLEAFSLDWNMDMTQHFVMPAF